NLPTPRRPMRLRLRRSHRPPPLRRTSRPLRSLRGSLFLRLRSCLSSSWPCAISVSTGLPTNAAPLVELTGIVKDLGHARAGEVGFLPLWVPEPRLPLAHTREGRPYGGSCRKRDRVCKGQAESRRRPDHWPWFPRDHRGQGVVLRLGGL